MSVSSTTEPSTRLALTRKLGLAVEIASSYAVARRLMRRRELRETVAALRRVQRTSDPDISPVRLGSAVGRTLRFLPLDSRCLMSSLVLTRLLARRGIPSVFVLGVRPGPDFGAHAWVECEGRPVLPPGDPSQERLLEL